MKKSIIFLGLIAIASVCFGDPILPSVTMYVSGFATGEDSNIGIRLTTNMWVEEGGTLNILVNDTTFSYYIDLPYDSTILTEITGIYLQPDSGSFIVHFSPDDTTWLEYLEDSIKISYGYHLFHGDFQVTINLPVTYFPDNNIYLPPPPPGYYYCFNTIPWDSKLFTLREIDTTGIIYSKELIIFNETQTTWFNEIAFSPTQYLEIIKPFPRNPALGDFSILTPTGKYDISGADTSGTYPVYYPVTNLYGSASEIFLYLLNDSGWVFDGFYTNTRPLESNVLNRVLWDHYYIPSDVPTPGEANLEFVQESTIKPNQRSVEILKTYPEPFNSQFTIAYTIPKNSRNLTTLKIHDINGRIVQKQQIPSSIGFHSKIITCQNLPSSIYFVSITNGSLKDTKTVTLIK
ncbi:T9SS type A sorting domain-containing protein [bacterium]|nr:T9SS type A sorting domain-containing protein [bacterium]